LIIFVILIFFVSRTDSNFVKPFVTKHGNARQLKSLQGTDVTITTQNEALRRLLSTTTISPDGRTVTLNIGKYTNAHKHQHRTN
jgi:hypothetical protein